MRFKIGDIIRSRTDSPWQKLKLIYNDGRYGVLILDTIFERRSEIGSIEWGVNESRGPLAYEDLPDWVLDESITIERILETYES